MTDDVKLSPRQVTILRKQLAVANERLVTLEREQRELRKTVAALRDQLKQTAQDRAS